MESRRYDGKLDNFLMQSLAEDEYERIATSEPCVVVCGEEKPAHKHAIVGHQHLYLTQFPPKKLKIAVQLEDVTSIQILDDLPDFLSGKEREGTTHVQIKYRRTVAGKEAKVILKSPANSDVAFSTSPSPSPTPSRSKNVRKSPKDEPSPLSMHTRTFPEEHRVVATGNSDIASSPPGAPSPNDLFRADRSPGTARDPAPRTPTSTQKLNASSDVISDDGKNSRKLPSKSHASSTPPPPSQGRALPPTPPTTSLLVTSPSPMRSSALATSSGSLTTSITSTSSSCPDLMGTRHTPLSHGDDPPPPPHSPSSGARITKRLGSSSLLPQGLLGSTLSVAPPTTEGSTSPPPHHTTGVLDLYVLKQNTDFYHQMITAWENFKIASTLKANNIKTSTSTSLSHDHFSRHFCALKSELLSPLLTPQGRGRLLLELATACQKYFVLKTLFWENAELINFCANQLDANMSSSSTNEVESLKDRAILLDVIYQVMGGTHMCLRRLSSFVSNGGLLLLTMATNTVQHFPSHVLDALGVQVLIEKSCGVLYELVRLAQQARWPLAERSVVCVSWLAEKLVSLTNMKNFSFHVVTYITKLLGGAEVTSGELPAPSLVGLYHAAFVINMLVHESPALAELFWSNFAEEFRYYISISGAQHHLPPNYPLRADTLELLRNAKTRVLNQSRTATGLN